MAGNIALSAGQPYFLQRKIHFYITLAVIATTLLSWFNVNSYLIILLAVCRLLDGKPATALRTAFSDKYFLAWLAIFLLDLAGLLYTHHFHTGWKYVESKATLVAIPFILCGSPFTDRQTRNKLLSGFCLLLLVICCYCLVIATIRYSQTKDPFVFFYHFLSAAIGINAVFLSAYIIVAILFILKDTPRSHLRTTMLFFFMIMLVLLASKLILLVLLGILSAYRSTLNRKPVILLALFTLLGLGMLAFTTNPVEERYKEIIPPYTVYNGVTLRWMIWKAAYEIVSEQKAWLTGVTAGDSQELLDKKYTAAGCKNFLGYNFHNQFIEIGVRSGLAGLVVFLVTCGLMLQLAGSAGTREAWFTVILVLLLCMTESMLEMQQPAFFSCFFILLNRPPVKH